MSAEINSTDWLLLTEPVLVALQGPASKELLVGVRLQVSKLIGDKVITKPGNYDDLLEKLVPTEFLVDQNYITANKLADIYKILLDPLDFCSESSVAAASKALSDLIKSI